MPAAHGIDRKDQDCSRKEVVASDAVVKAGREAQASLRLGNIHILEIGERWYKAYSKKMGIAQYAIRRERCTEPWLELLRPVVN
jgi:hypothetical protein